MPPTTHGSCSHASSIGVGPAAVGRKTTPPSAVGQWAICCFRGLRWTCVDGSLAEQEAYDRTSKHVQGRPP